MPRSHQIRRIQPAAVADFDEQLWPINCALLILAGCVVGVVLGTSDFHDPRILYNGWARLIGVGLSLGVLFWGVVLLQGRMLRRLQLCILVSLLVHLLLAVHLHDRYLAVLAQREVETARRIVDTYEPVTLPDYHWEQIDQPEIRQDFDEPIETDTPRPSQSDALKQQASEPEMPTELDPPDEPEIPQRQQPNPALTHRAELSAPRRADAAAGGQISRQQWKHRPNPNRPVPEPAVQPKPRQATALAAANIAPRQRETNEDRIDQQQAFREHSSIRPEPTPVKMARRANSPEPISKRPSTPQPSREARQADQIARTAKPEPQPIRQAEQSTEVAAVQVPQQSSVTRQSSREIASVPKQLAAAAMTERAELPTAIAPRREATVEQQTPRAETTPARPSSLARSEQGAPLPSTAIAVEVEAVARPAATGTATASRLQLAQSAAVRRAGTSPSVQGTAPVAGSAELAIGSAQIAARTGQARARGIGRPSSTTNAPERRIARAAGPVATSTAASGATQAVAATPAAVASTAAGPKNTPRIGAASSAARRGGMVSTLAPQPAPGAGPAESSGMAGAIGVAQTQRVTRYESSHSAVAGGGTPQPARTRGVAAMPSATAETPQAIAAAEGGGNATQAPPAHAQVSGPRRDVAGLPGSLQSQPRAGAAASLLSDGSPLAAAVARRATASRELAGERQLGAAASTTLARKASGVDLPAAATVVKNLTEPGAGGLASVQGAMTSSLPASRGASVRQAAADVLVGALTLAGATADSGYGSATDAALAGEASDSPSSMDEMVLAAAYSSDSDEQNDTMAADSGPRRVPQGDQPGPSAAAEVGRGPLRSVGIPGLPRGTAEVAQQQPLATAAESDSGEMLQVADGLGPDEPSRQSGGLPVQIAAMLGPGGLGEDPMPEVGLPSRRARPESDVVHTVARRFIIERSGGRLALDGQLRAQPTEAFRQRDLGSRSQVAQARGGSEGTEKAVEMGLDFLARHQFPDGHWSLHKLPPGLQYEDPALGTMQSDSAATGLALLAYFGAGYTHLDDKHRAVVARGLDWLVRNQKDSGELFTGGSRFTRFYSHGIAAIALCEAYGMTRDPQLREPAALGVDFIIKTQHPTRGGWRYDLSPQGVSTETDTSVSGWQLMALKSAQMAGLEIPSDVLPRIGRWLDSAKGQGQDGRYVYNPHAADTASQRHGRQVSRAMTAEAMTMRMYLGVGREDPSLKAGADYLKKHLPEVGTQQRPLRDCYYWYYATQAMFHLQGDYWTAWNDRFRPLAQSSQVQFGEKAGSWHPMKPIPDRWGHAGGRHYVTALNLLMLEVYYRHLPLFQELVK